MSQFCFAAVPWVTAGQHFIVLEKALAVLLSSTGQNEHQAKGPTVPLNSSTAPELATEHFRAWAKPHKFDRSLAINCKGFWIRPIMANLQNPSFIFIPHNRDFWGLLTYLHQAEKCILEGETALVSQWCCHLLTCLGFQKPGNNDLFRTCLHTINSVFLLGTHAANINNQKM